MEGQGLTIAALADLSGVEITELVAILFGLKEMKRREWELISGALGVDLGTAFVGIRFVPEGGRDGRGAYLL
jgi:hypothetical protein